MSSLILPPSAQRSLERSQHAEKAKRIDDFVAVAKSFLGPGAGTGPGVPSGAMAARPGSPMKTGWTSNLGNAALLQRAAQTYSQQHNVPAAELEQALSDQGLSWDAPFSPGRPLDPFAGYREPARTRSYQVGENVQVTPRHGRVSFETLKALYGAWDVPQICVQHLVNDVRSLDISWLPADGVKTDVSADIEAAEAFFLCPDRRRPFRAWLAMWLQDIFRWDAGALYIRRNNAGDPIALEVVDGTTIIPLADYYGRIPMDEDDGDADPGDELDGAVVPAYVQAIMGMPWTWLSASDLIYQPLNPVSESQYGLAPLEKVLLTGNTDVRFQMHFLEYFCYGEGTEILTRHGWRSFSEIDGTEEFATRSPDGQFEWQATKDGTVHRFDYDGELVHFASRNVDCMVTPNHRMLVRVRPHARTGKDCYRDWHIREAQHFVGLSSRHYQVPVCSIWDAGVEPHEVPCGMAPEVWARFLGIFIAEGCLERSGEKLTGRIFVSQSPTHSHWDEVAEILQATGLRWSNSGNNFYVRHPELAEALVAYGHKAPNKVLSRGVLDWPRSLLELLLDAMCVGDGSIANGEQQVYYTSSVALAGQVQEIWQKLGVCAPVSKRGGMYRVGARKADAYALPAPTLVPYHGVVSCVSVPNGIVYVRRNGKALWSGNTDGSLPAGLMEAPPDMSDPAQLQEWQDVWDALMVGDQAMLRKIRWVPSGAKFSATKNSDFDEKFPLYLMRRCCAAHGVTPADLGFTETVNKSSGDSQIDIQFRVGTRPPIRHVEDILSLFAQRDLGLRVKLQIDDGREVEDRVATAQAHSIYIQAGVESPDEVRDEIGKPTDKTQAVSRFIQTRQGITMLEALLGQTKNPIDPETYAPAGKVEYVEPPEPIAPPAKPPAAGVPPAQAGATEQAAASDTTPAGQKPAIPGGQDAANTNTSPVAKADQDVGKRSGMVSLDLPKGLLPIHEDGIDDHHITVVFLGQNVTDDQFEQVCGRAAQVAADTPPLQGTIGGLGTFAPGEDGTPVFAVPDVPGLDELRAAFEEFNASEHSEFRPHVTLTYHQAGDPMPEPTPQTAVTFGAISVHRGEDCQSFPFTGAASKALTAGITAQSGIQGADLLGRHDPDEDEDEDLDDDEIAKALIDVSLRRWKANARNRLRKGQAPRRFVDPSLPSSLHDAVWARLEHASSRAEVDAAFAALPKARARKAGAPTLADFHRQTDAIVAHYAPLIATALAGLWSEATLKKAWDAAQSASKAVADPPAGPGTSAGPVEQVLSDEQMAAGAQGLRTLLAEMYGDAALQGAHEAAHASGATIVSSLQGVTEQLPGSYWSTWERGWGQAAAKDADGGLKALLDQADITIRGLTDSAIRDMGDAIGRGIEAGDSYEATAKEITAIVGSPARADLIANTEYGRAMSAASMDEYAASGVQEKDWLCEDDACELCQANAAASPLGIDEDWPSGEYPCHPGDRCAVAPHL